MSEAPLTMGQLNSMHRVTPTDMAEELYQEQQARRYPVAFNKQGLGIPQARAPYRTTVDGPLLKQIIKAAYAAYCDREVTPYDYAEAQTAMAEEIARRFPPEDMEVLERYGHAQTVEKISVSIDHPTSFGPHEWITLPWPAVMPKSVGCFRMTFEGARIMSTAAPAVPEALEPYFTKINTIRQAKAGFNQLSSFPTQFKAREKRWPRWFEIEREHAEVGRWLAEQRKEAA